jgi:putative OPT family oligopeptide transporter
MGQEKKPLKPYVPPEQAPAELTVTSVLMGILLAVVFGAANAYLGLRVGMTVSASIPAAVLSMGVMRVLLRRESVLENNMVQTIGSAGESLAAGAIFTMPVLFLWSAEGILDTPNLAEIGLIALLGGVLGVLFMVPLRQTLIVKEHGALPYPEGTACAQVLLAGEEKGGSAGTVFAGMGLAALCKFLVDGLKAIPGAVTVPIKALKTEFSAQVYPALLGVGYICGPRIAAYMFAGGILGWFVLIPAIGAFGGSTVLYPGTETVEQIYASAGASGIWSSYIRYIGAGAVAAGGLISLCKSVPMILKAFGGSFHTVRNQEGKDVPRTERNLHKGSIGILLLLAFLALWLLPQLPIAFPGACLILLFGFLFAAVSSRMVGLVGSSNNPVSGMAIAALLAASLFLKSTGKTGSLGMAGAIAIGSVICIIAAMAGDTSQDLKTGYLLGATPKKQQLGELIGVVVSALTIGGVLVLLDKAWGFGSAELAAPQATLMKLIVEGVMEGNLPWTLLFIGVFLAVAVELLQIPALPVAIGLYLPLELSSTILLGGILRFLADRRRTREERANGRGILFCSGLIAGEGLAGIFLAVLAVAGLADRVDVSGRLSTGRAGGILLLALLCGTVLCSVFPPGKKYEKKREESGR